MAPTAHATFIACAAHIARMHLPSTKPNANPSVTAQHIPGRSTLCHSLNKESPRNTSIPTCYHCRAALGCHQKMSSARYRLGSCCLTTYELDGCLAAKIHNCSVPAHTHALHTHALQCDVTECQLVPITSSVTMATPAAVAAYTNMRVKTKHPAWPPDMYPSYIIHSVA
jgi:hypothetical protein